MKKITIEPGCITCGLCAFVAPEVFEVTDVAHVKDLVSIADYAQEIEQAIAGCPVQVISKKKE